MKKRIFAAILTLCLIYSSLAFAEENAAFDVILYDFDVFFNGEKLNFNSPLLLIDGQTYVPLRDFAEEIDMTVDWNDDDKKINLFDNSLNIKKKFCDIFEFELPETAKILDYSYCRDGKDDYLDAKIFFEKSDLEYMRDGLDKTTMLRTPEENENVDLGKVVLRNLARRYDWWDISSPYEIQYIYSGFRKDGWICEAEDSGGYYLYVSGATYFYFTY